MSSESLFAWAESFADDQCSSSSDYITVVDIGTSDGVVTNVTKQGGIVSVYYLGAIVGCFVG